MNEDRFMRELGARAKEEKAEDGSLPAALARPLDAGELDRILEHGRAHVLPCYLHGSLDGATAKLGASGNVVPIGAARKR